EKYLSLHGVLDGAAKEALAAQRNWISTQDRETIVGRMSDALARIEAVRDIHAAKVQHVKQRAALQAQGERDKPTMVFSEAFYLAIGTSVWLDSTPLKILVYHAGLDGYLLPALLYALPIVAGLEAVNQVKRWFTKLPSDKDLLAQFEQRLKAGEDQW